MKYLLLILAFNSCAINPYKSWSGKARIYVDSSEDAHFIKSMYNAVCVWNNIIGLEVAEVIVESNVRLEEGDGLTTASINPKKLSDYQLGSAETRYMASRIYESDLYFKLKPNMIKVTIHEVGHLLGYFGHSKEVESMMNAHAFHGQTILPADAEYIRNLYKHSYAYKTHNKVCELGTNDE